MKKLLLLAGLAAFAVPAAHGGGAFTIYSENDKYFAGTDRHYTNGFKLTYADELEHPRLNALGRLLDRFGRHLAVL